MRKKRTRMHPDAEAGDLLSSNPELLQDPDLWVRVQGSGPN